MAKSKFVLGLSLAVAMFAITATPSFAQWTNPGGTGAGVSGPGTFTYSALGSVKCEKATGSYSVNATGTAVKLEGITWKECKTSFGGAATVSCKGLEMKQPTKQGKVSGSALGTSTETCKVIGGGCAITIEPEGNKELSAIALTKVGSNQEDKVNLVENITAKAEKNAGETCLLGAKTTKASEKVASLVLEGVGLE